MRNTILVKGNPVKNEGTSGAAIMPGMLVELDDSGEILPHGTAGGNAAAYFAKERDHQSVDTEIPIGEQVGFWACPPGTEVYAWLDDGENVDIGDYLESDGDGHLQEHTPQAVDEDGSATYTIHTRAVVAQALEALNNDSGAPARILVRVV